MRQANKKKIKTHFEQVPLQAIDRLRRQEVADKKATGRSVNVVVETPATKTQPYSVRNWINTTGR